MIAPFKIASLQADGSSDDDFAFDDGGSALVAADAAGAELIVPPSPPPFAAASAAVKSAILADASEALAKVGALYREEKEEEEEKAKKSVENASKEVWTAPRASENAHGELGTLQEIDEVSHSESHDEDSVGDDASPHDDDIAAAAATTDPAVSITVDWDAVSRSNVPTQRDEARSIAMALTLVLYRVAHRIAFAPSPVARRICAFTLSRREASAHGSSSASAPTWMEYEEAERYFCSEAASLRTRYADAVLLSDLTLGGYSALQRVRFRCFPATRPRVRFDALSGRLGLSGADELELVFLIAKTPLRPDGHNLPPSHGAILQSIWKLLTSSTLDTARQVSDCARMGAHWTQIGFQGADPGTDLRAAGMLAMILMLRFAAHSTTRARAVTIRALSRDPVQNFPMMAAGIRWTLIALRTLRGGRLLSLCTRASDVFGPLHDLYGALWKEFFTRWRVEKLTIVDFEPLAKRIELRCLKAPVRFIDSAGSIGSG